MAYIGIVLGGFPHEVYQSIDGDSIFKDYDIENLMEVDVFRGTDERIIDWALERLLDENLNVEVNGLPLVDVFKSRKFKHFKDLHKDGSSL
ncbi:MAG TPA: hypothetical protein GXX70_00195 [Tepidimicrobium sp.]|nr:hypothetical protein [Tepidimicrobium sp.]